MALIGKVTNVSKRFGVVQALKDVSLAFNAGEVLALVGENGAGKSTLMRILEGEHRPDSGTVSLSGQDVRFNSAREAHRYGVRVVHQEPELIPELTVAENIFIGDYNRKVGLFLDWEKLEKRTLELLDTFNVQRTLRPRQRCLNLGPAQRQLIEIMRALREGLKLLALDEPTSSLTDEESQALFGLIERLVSQGVGVIYISHRLREVMQLADRVAVLRDGRLVDVCSADAINEQEMMRLMVGRSLGSVFNFTSHKTDRVVLELRNVSTETIHDVSFKLHEGEVLGLAGLIGAGRTELAKTIFGDDGLEQGAILLNNTPLHLRNPSDAIASGIGLVPEDRKEDALLLMRSVRNNVSLCSQEKISRFGFVRGTKESDLIHPIVERLQVKTPTLEQPVGKLSGGNQQKVVFARWLVRDLKVLILDEPTRGIDVGAKAEIYQLIQELAASGIAVLLISSELPEILGLTDRILVMRSGKVVGEKATSETSEHELLHLAMGETLHSGAQRPNEGFL